MAVRSLAVPLRETADLFTAVCLRGADTLISDATRPRMQGAFLQWYRKQPQCAHLLAAALQIKGRPFALIYADQEHPPAPWRWTTRCWGCCARCATRPSWRFASAPDGQGGCAVAAIIAPWPPRSTTRPCATRSAPVPGFDGWLVAIVLMLAAAGLLAMYSAGYDHGTRFVDHGRNMLIAAGILFVVAQVPPQRIMALAVPLYTLGVACWWRWRCSASPKARSAGSTWASSSSPARFSRSPCR